MASTTIDAEEMRVKWFYIKSASSDNVVSAAKVATDDEPLMRSQVYVCSPRHVDEEQWCWDGQHLVNKATELVLDIRKGRLRLIEDTDICIYSKKPEDEALNQRWSVQCDDPNIPTYYICSQSNSGWVLDIRTGHQSGDQKLILSPHQTIDKENQLWVFVSAENASNGDEGTESIATKSTDDAPHTCCPSHARTLVIRISGDIPHHFITEAYRFSNNPFTAMNSSAFGASLSRTLSHASTSSSHSINEQDQFPAYGLTPAKRGSQSSVTAGLTLNAFKECHQLVYLERNPHLSDKTIAMAAAYHVWQTWKEQQVSLLTRQSGGFASEEQEDAETTRARLQAMAQDEASKIFDHYSDQLNNHKETALVLTKRLIISLCTMTPQSP
ncbi:hypothetical protein BDB00DRAFT_39413 [Zychaea mexicana]|uniref:uncharacterized protein n=1 Tax=Zychaea mexicana TaxID=64656 RepID=UPI0022FE1CC6|nr:uncharacterized protein BDB00DRAFT_39413 [Zychaea mexicana]KAI9488476.1 hypothetical protein BDB00DRAFT_39413 [Zychaea mexicana]